MKKILIPLATLATILLTACNSGTSQTPVSQVPAEPTPPAVVEQPFTEPVQTESAAATYTLTEVAQHKTAEDCWMAVNGKVYDVTKFIALGVHNPKILDGCGIDATELFKAVEKHGEPAAQGRLTENLIGTLN